MTNSIVTPENTKLIADMKRFSGDSVQAETLSLAIYKVALYEAKK